MSSIRMQIAEVQIMIRQIKADLADAKTSAQGAAVTAAGGFKAIGANKEEREFALEQAVNDSPAVKRYARDLMTAESKLARLEAVLADAQADEQRDRWAIRARFVDALERVQFPAADSFFSGGEIDKAMDEVADSVADVYAAHAAKPGWSIPGYTPPPLVSITRRDDVAAFERTVAERRQSATYPRNLTPDQIDAEADELFG